MLVFQVVFEIKCCTRCTMVAIPTRYAIRTVLQYGQKLALDCTGWRLAASAERSNIRWRREHTGKRKSGTAKQHVPIRFRQRWWICARDSTILRGGSSALLHINICGGHSRHESEGVAQHCSRHPALPTPLGLHASSLRNTPAHVCVPRTQRGTPARTRCASLARQGGLLFQPGGGGGETSLTATTATTTTA